jgi:hypothetical protein
MFGLIVRRHDGWPGRHVRGLMLLFALIPNYSAGRNNSNRSEYEAISVSLRNVPSHNVNPESKVEIRGGFSVDPPS